MMIQGLITKATKANIQRMLQFHSDGTAYISNMFVRSVDWAIHFVIEPELSEPSNCAVSFWDASKIEEPKEAAKDLQDALDGITGWKGTDGHQEILQPIWDKYNLWATLVVVKRIPKKKKERKSDSQVMRVGSPFAGAVANGVSLPFEAKRVLFELLRFAPKKEIKTQQNIFQTMLFEDGSETATLGKKSLKSMAENIFGHAGNKEIWRVVKALDKAALTTQTIVKVVDVKDEISPEGNKRRRTTYRELTGSFISTDITRQEITEKDMTIKLPPEKVNITFHQIFGYWINHYYQAIDVPRLLERSREKNGEEYFAIRLWAIDLYPNIKKAKDVGSGYEATFRFEKLSGYGERDKDDRQRVRQRCEAIADEICQDMEADLWEIVQERNNGGLRNVGIKFVWMPGKGEISGSAE